MLDDCVAKSSARAGAKVDHAAGNSRFFENLNKPGRDGWRVAGGLQDDCIAGDDGGRSHAGHNREREIPRRNDRTHAERDIEQPVAFARVLDGRGSRGEAQGFARVELEEVDGLGYVGIGFGPILADFVGEPRTKLELAFTDDVRRVEQELNALVCRGAAPGFERRQGRRHGLLRVFGAGLLVHANDLLGPSGIE